MIAAFDVQYFDEDPATTIAARAGAVVFQTFTDAQPVATYQKEFASVETYVPGEFYRRELPCLLALIADIREALHTFIVDGYVQLGPAGTSRPGLGQHLAAQLAAEPSRASYTVVGVAKSHFAGSVAAEVFRGGSQRPLYVTSTGNITDAADRVRSMHGPHRIPTLLRLVDHLARGIVSA